MERGPHHVALIMDGNGRWAAQHGLQRSAGHLAGERAMVETVTAAVEAGVGWLSLYAFSTENWSRAEAEVAFLMRLNYQSIRNNASRWNRLGVRLRYLGAADPRIPTATRREIARIEELTHANTRMTVTMAFDHGGREDLVRAARSLIRAKVPADQVTAATLTEHMQFPDLPDIDLLVRTSGEHRLSNFLLWQAAYAELVFLDTLWPDFTPRHLHEAFDVFRTRRRRFGGAGTPP